MLPIVLLHRNRAERTMSSRAVALDEITSFGIGAW